MGSLTEPGFGMGEGSRCSNCGFFILKALLCHRQAREVRFAEPDKIDSMGNVVVSLDPGLAGLCVLIPRVRKGAVVTFSTLWQLTCVLLSGCSCFLC